MPKVVKRLSQDELNSLKYVSMADFSKRIDKIEHIDDKLKFASQYLILHGSNGEPDCSLDDAINIARMKIADASYELRQEAKALSEKKNSDDDIVIIKESNDLPYAVNPLTSVKKDKNLELFMGHPTGYLKSFAFERFNQIENQQAELQDETKFKEACMKFYNLVINIDGDELNASARRNLHVNNRLESMFGGKAALEKAYRDTKPSFFSKMFNTPSIASGNLDAVYRAFNDPKHALYGNINALEKAANEYLIHKIPNWKPGEPFPKETDLDKLDSTEKGRTIFSVAILKAVDKEHKNESVYETIVKGCAADNNLQDELDHISNVNQTLFQQKLFNDIKDDIETGIIVPEVDKNNVAEVEKSRYSIESNESKLDKSEISVLELKKQEEDA